MCLCGGRTVGLLLPSETEPIGSGLQTNTSKAQKQFCSLLCLIDYGERDIDCVCVVYVLAFVYIFASAVGGYATG